MSIDAELVRSRRDPWLQKIEGLLPDTGAFWYLAGPMSGKPGFNYAEFDRVAGKLRDHYHVIVSPAEFEFEHERKRIMEAEGHEPHDTVGPKWTDCLARDVTVVSHARCRGIIVIDGWQGSKGAKLETHVCDSLGKPIMEYVEYGEELFSLVEIDRAVAMQQWDDAQDAIKRVKESAERWDSIAPYSPPGMVGRNRRYGGV